MKIYSNNAGSKIGIRSTTHVSRTVECRPPVLKYLDIFLLRLVTKAEAKFSSVFAFLKLIKGCQHTLDEEIMKETDGKQDGKPSHDMLLLPSSTSPN